MANYSARVAYGVTAAGVETPLPIDANGKLDTSATLSGDVTAATEFAEDSAHTTGDKGIQVLTVRQDSASALGGTNGDYQPLITDATGHLHVVDQGASRLTTSACAAAGTGSAATTALMAGGVYNATPPSIADGKQIALQVDAAGALKVSGAGGGTQYAEDAAHTSGDTGTMVLAVRKDAAGTLAGTDGDYAPLQVTAGGSCRIVPCKADGTAVDPVADVAHDAADSGAPVKIGARAIATMSGGTNVAAADRTDLLADLDGALIIRRNTTLGDRISGVATNTDGTSTSCIAAQASGVKTYITDVTICNSSATFVTVDLRDGAAGTVKWTFPVPPSGGVTHAFNSPLAGSAATAWCFDPSAAATTITCSLSGFISKV